MTRPPEPSGATRLAGRQTTLRPATDRDVVALVAIRSTPEVWSRWLGSDLGTEVRDALTDDDLHLLVIEDATGRVIGAIQWAASDDPQYPYASVDLFLHPSVHGQGLGTDAARTLCRHLLTARGFHRVVIDPAADNAAAIRCYEKVGFQRVGIMRSYERGPDGSLHDGLLMDLLADEITDDGPETVG